MASTRGGADPLVIAVSINGERTKSDNPNTPRTPDEITAAALSCYRAGASIIHAHATAMGVKGAEAAQAYLAAWRPVKAHKPDAAWYPTLTNQGGQELEHVRLIDEAVGLEFACVDPGATPVARLDESGLPTGRYYENSFEQIRSAFAQLREMRLGAQIAIYEPHYLRTVLAYHRAGRLPAGSVVNFYFGGWDCGPGGTGTLSFGLPPTPAALQAYLDLLGDADLPWTVSCWGGDLLATELPRMAIEMGGHVQVGLESHFDPVRKPTNEAQIRHVAAMAAEAGRPLADCRATLEVWRAPKARASKST